MYRLLIIDDEIATREQIRASVNWEKMNIEIVGEAEDGLNALVLSEELLPDIVICDVRMPHMDGISFAMEFSSRFPSAQLIFLSGYTDKLYMQSAVRLSAVDYIFKPFTLSDLLTAVEKAIHRLRTSVHNNLYTADDDSALKVLYKSSAPDFGRYLSELTLPVSFDKPYAAILIRLNSGITFSSQKILDSLELQSLTNNYYYITKSELPKILGKENMISKCGNGYIIFSNVPDTYTQDILSERLSALLNIFDEVNVAIGISRIFHSPDFLNKAFCEARTATLTAFFRGYKRIFITEAGQKNMFSLEHNARKCYCNCLEKLNIMQASSYLDDYFVYLSNCDVQNISDIRDDLLQLTLDLNKKLANPPSQLISEFVNEAATLEDLHHYIQQLLTLYLSEIENKNNYSKIVYEAEKYITNHLSDTLTVKEIADHVFVSPTYLCFLYKKQTGKTLKQFILDIRMQKAKALLLDTNMKIGDIAASLGYMNQNYFTRIFTSYYGTTPSIFRNKNYSYKNTED